jgi:phosphoadenosine phosphosulfate reductase
MMNRQMPLLLSEAIETSMQILRDNQPLDAPYYGCFSGGKDSVVIKRLAELAGVNVVWHYNPCPDPPELIRFIRKQHPDVTWNKPKKPIWTTLTIAGMPSAWYRVCCNLAKEAHGKGVMKIVGVRAAESPRRARSWQHVSMEAIAPILQWGDDDVWKFIQVENIPYCSLYDEGFTRLGCVGCPLAGQKSRDAGFARWPKYERWWMHMCKKLWESYANDEAWIARQAGYGFHSWEDHWAAWRGGMGEYLKKYKQEHAVDNLCGDNDLTRYMQ